MFSRLIGGVSLAALAVVANAQVFYDSSHKVLLPSSSMAQKGMRARTHYLINVAPDPVDHVWNPTGGAGANVSPAISGYFPKDIRAAYKMPAAGGSNAIAIVDAYHNPTALADFNTFATQFGLPKETSTSATASTNTVFRVVYANGLPANNSGWAGEIALDIEWAHAIAPKAKIYLVEAKNNSFTELWKAIHIAKTLPGVHQISMSFGANEGGATGLTGADEATLDPELIQAGVSFFASSGDDGGVRQYPAESPNVVAVGGTRLFVNSSGVVTSETGWTGSGGGISQFEARPSYQSVIAGLVGTKRGCPDISGVADPGTGVAVFSTYAFGGWAVIGGTSLACPVMAGVANVRGAFSTGTAAENARNYFWLGTSRVFRDITSGTAGAYTAVAGWDRVTGSGSPTGMYPVPTPFYPYYGAVQFGTYVSGALADTYTTNTISYIVASKPTTASFGETAGAYYAVKFGAAAASYAKIFIYLTSLTTLNSTVELWCYDYTQSKYVLIGTYANTAAYGTRYWSPNPATSAKYMDVNHAFHILVRAHTPGANVLPFQFKQDRVLGVGYL